MGVNIIKSFISKEDIKDYIEFLDSKATKTPLGIWNALGYENSLQASKVNGEIGALIGDESSVNKKLGALFELVKKEAEKIYDAELDLCQGSYQSLPPGVGNDLHADRVRLDGTPIQEDGTEEELEWSGLIYLNTYGEDFTGGEIEWPEFDLVYKPQAGDVVIFKGDLEHKHLVKKVISGDRKNLVLFWAKKGNVSGGKLYFNEIQSSMN